MGEPNIRLVRRTTPRFNQTYVAQPDAVNETLRVRGMAPEQVARRQATVQETRQTQKQKTNAQKKKRNAYRQRRFKEKPLEGLLSDEQVDAALLQEERMANQPQLSQGSTQPQMNTNRMADQYANVSNFYAALGSPNMMPMSDAQVRANPQVASQQLQFGLDNPALTALQFATPMGSGSGAFGAAKTAFQTGMQAAKPVATKVAQATGQAVKAGGKAVAQNAPKVAANALIMGVPATAAAADFGNENPNAQGQQSGGSVMPWIIGSGVVIGGGALFNKFRKGITLPKWFTWWERNPNTIVSNTRFNTLRDKYNAAFAAGDQAAMDALKTEVGKSPQATITQGTGKRAKTVDNPDFISNIDLGTMIKNRTYPQIEGSIIEQKSARFWRGFRNFGLRLPLYSTVVGNILQGGYNWAINPTDGQGNPLPTAEQYAPTYQETDDAVEQRDTISAKNQKIQSNTDNNTEDNVNESNSNVFFFNN